MGRRDIPSEVGRELTVQFAKDLLRLVELAMASLTASTISGVWKLTQGGSVPEALNLGLSTLVLILLSVLVIWILVAAACTAWSMSPFGNADVKPTVAVASAQEPGETLPRAAQHGTAGPVSDMTSTLLGSWFVQDRIGHRYMAQWTFHPGGYATVKAHNHDGNGKWSIERDCVHIVWNAKQPDSEEQCWDSFLLPLNPEDTNGDSWNGKDRWCARKLCGN